MKIDRSNYEIWIIDWLDGNLNEDQIARLQFFLNMNPDLKAEYDELNLVSLNPANQSFPHKNDLKKTISDLTEAHFEHLSIGYLENDLSPDQKIELKESIGHDQARKRTFELIQKTKITPVEVFYKNKKRLLKRTTAQKVLRLSLIGLSSAAIITLVIINFFPIPRTLSVKSEKTAESIISETTTQLHHTQKISDKLPKEKNIPYNKPNEEIVATRNLPVVAISEPAGNPKDSSFRSPDDPAKLVNKIPVVFTIDLKQEPTQNTLIALNLPVIIPEYDDGQSKLGRFIARTFREKILKEKVVKDSPLRAYEIAEAGVSGLNKLLGWQMALDEKNDENGELKSVYFSSKILKFKAPVKKSEPLP